MRKNFLSWYPQVLRQAALVYRKGQVAIEAPAAALVRYSPERGNVGWETLCEVDEEGKTVVTAPKFLTDLLMERLIKAGIPFEHCTMGK